MPREGELEALEAELEQTRQRLAGTVDQLTSRLEAQARTGLRRGAVVLGAGVVVVVVVVVLRRRGR
ncbi:DUF3618 domain-containing protein [Nocardioides sp. SYSU D00038]|uniref:DUF3618 domain-containing protein n=1 Tax=Nocardioides sp. SYSU D00038 TaxID=2812554 RepID=UPI00196834E2|nr:DUF3618 domain-containing protein [Nocardioides sp. SYSU D00038]